MHRHAPGGQRQPDPAGADGQFQGPPAARQLGEQANCRVNRLRLEHFIGRVVIPRRDLLPEVPVWIIHEMTT